MGFSSKGFLAILLIALAASLACQMAHQSFVPPPEAHAPALIAAGDPPTQENTQAAAAEPQTKPPVPPQLQVDPIADLIARVEKEYLVGRTNYEAGHLEAAKQNFDSAFNQLLSSGLDLQSDDRLQQELDRILDGVNGLELAALQQGDGFQEQRSEPAPIDEANELNPTPDKNVKATAEAEVKSTRSGLPLVMTDQVAGYITYFSTRGRGTLERALAHSGRYEDMIRRVLREEGVPLELIYLAQAESGFHPLAVSRAGARGMWQFMGSRAKGYGLERSWWVDDRQDPEKATRAAARHLHDLYNEFGDWYLAMAAYNSGPGSVQSAVRRTGYADFWELYRRNVLPKETRNYVPIILAVTIMAKNPKQYGLDSVVKDKPIPSDTVKIDYPIDLRLAAECVDATTDDLLELNPSLLRMTTPKFEGGISGEGNSGDGSNSAAGSKAHQHQFELHLPAGTAGKFQIVVASIPVDKRVWWRYHKVTTGETLASIARTYRTTPTAIAEANNINEGLNHELDRAAVEADTRLIIPIAAAKNNERDISTYARATTRYKVRRGDTVGTVAANFGVSEKMLRGWNHLKGDSLAGRRVLYLHLPVTRVRGEEQEAGRRPGKTRSKTGAHGGVQAASSNAKLAAKPGPKAPAKAGGTAVAVTHHKVKAGETLYSIANSYNTTVTALKHDNRNIASLRPGMILIIHNSR